MVWACGTITKFMSYSAYGCSLAALPPPKSLLIRAIIKAEVESGWSIVMRSFMP